MADPSTTIIEALQKVPTLLSRGGQEIPKSIIDELKAGIKCDIVVKGEASAEVYNAAIDRWNKASVKEAVRYLYPNDRCQG
jgi:hypothetical protein